MHWPHAVLYHGLSPSVIVCNLDIVGAISHPSETDTPFVVDSDAVLPRTITFQFLQSISWRSQQVIEVGGTV